jgi:hypothetical protein
MPLLNGDSVTVAYFLIRSKIRLSVLMRLAEDESMTYRPCGQASRIPTCSFRRCRPRSRCRIRSATSRFFSSPTFSLRERRR